MLKRKTALVLMSLMIGLSSPQAVFAEDLPKDSILICDEDEITIICDNKATIYSRFYDCYGNCLGSMGYNAGFYNINTKKIGTVFVSEEKDQYVVYRLTNPLTIVGKYPKDQFRITVHRNGFSVETYSDSESPASLDSSSKPYRSFYDAYGNCLFEIPGHSTAIEVFNVDHDYYIAWYSFNAQAEELEENPNPYIYHLVKIDSASGEPKEIFVSQTNDPYYLNKLSIYGDYILWNNQVLDLNGNIPISDITINDDRIYRIESGENGQILSVIGYDRNLQPHEIQPEIYKKHEYQLEIMEHNNDYLGASSERLNGQICDGWVSFCGPHYYSLQATSPFIKDFYPYTRTDETHILANIDGLIEEFLIKKNEELVSLNDDFYLTYAPKKNLYRLRKRRTGNVLLTAQNLCLGDGYCLSTEWDDTQHIYMHTTYEMTRDPETGEEIFSANNLTCQEIYPWKNGLLFMVRGAYSGLADPKGNWVIKCASVEM